MKAMGICRLFMTGVSLLFILLPFLVIIPASFTEANFPSFPPHGFSFRWYEKILERPEFIYATLTSIKFALLTAFFSLMLGTISSIAISKYNLPGKSYIISFLTAPLTVPQLVLGISLLIFFTPMGLAGTGRGLLIAHLIISIPYVMRLVLTGLSGFDYTLEQAAAILGANPFRVFWKVTMPLIRPAMFSGAMFSFLISFDNVTVSLFLISNDLQTLPVVLYSHMQDSYDPLVASISSVVIFISIILIIIVEKTHGIGRFFGSTH